jgi:hypothetical protein
VILLNRYAHTPDELQLSTLLFLNALLKHSDLDERVVTAADPH